MNIYEGPMDMDSGEGTGYGTGGWAGWRGGEGAKWDNCNSMKTKCLYIKEMAYVQRAELPELPWSRVEEGIRRLEDTECWSDSLMHDLHGRPKLRSMKIPRRHSAD